MNCPEKKLNSGVQIPFYFTCDDAFQPDLTTFISGYFSENNVLKLLKKAMNTFDMSLFSCVSLQETHDYAQTQR